MTAYLDRVRRLSALLYLVSVAIALVAIVVSSSVLIGRPTAYAPLAVVVATGALVYWFLGRALLRGPEPSEQGSGRLETEVAEREPAEPALRLLSEASAALSTSLDYDQTLQAVARLAVPAFADWCRLDLVDALGRVEPAAAAATDPSREGPLRQLQHRFPLDADGPGPAGRALRTGEAVLVGEVDEDQLAADTRDAEHAALIRRIGLASLVAAPVGARGRTLGVLTFATGQSGRRYGPRDLPLAMELARRAGMALEGARLHRDLQRALETRDEYLSHAAHDLKNPLTTARAQSQLLRGWSLRDVPPPIERVLQGFDRLDTSITKMARLIDELRDVANLEVGRPLALRPEPVDLVALARQSVTEYQLATRRHQLRLESDLETLVGTWDAGRLDRVLANLLDNALKYTPNGGDIVVVVGREAAESGELAVLSVRDGGIGIPHADQPHIFNRHHRAANVVRRIVGSGLGLAGVRAILEQHGGRIEVESQEGVGSIFTLRLPLALAAERLVQDDGDVEPAGLTGRALDRRGNLG